MNAKEFLNNISKSRIDIVQFLIGKINELKIDYCVIGGLAVNAYAEPVASLDLDLVFAVDDIKKFLENTKEIFDVTKSPHSLNLKNPQSDLRIQFQTDLRYQVFIKNASEKNILGYKMKVASLEDVLKGKTWAYMDEERRKSKRQKDLADIMRLVESHPHLYNLLPDEIKKKIE